MTHTHSFKAIGPRDYAAILDSEEISYHTTAIEAENAARQAAYDLIKFESRFIAETCEVEEVAAPAATVAAPVASNPLQAITRESVHAVVVKAKAQVADQTRWLNALNRAEDALLSNQWVFTGTTLKIHSKSRKLTYTITGNDCTCESASNGKPCYHVAAWRILVRATQSAAA